MGGALGERGAGRNRIERVPGGYVIEENFSTDNGLSRGHSVSVFDANAGMWRQTWVVSRLHRADGEVRGREDDPVHRAGRARGHIMVNRMVFHDITEQSLRWDRQGSRDGGETWTDLWKIDYRVSLGESGVRYRSSSPSPTRRRRTKPDVKRCSAIAVCEMRQHPRCPTPPSSREGGRRSLPRGSRLPPRLRYQ